MNKFYIALQRRINGGSFGTSLNANIAGRGGQTGSGSGGGGGGGGGGVQGGVSGGLADFEDEMNYAVMGDFEFRSLG